MKIAVFLPQSPWGDLDHHAMGQGLGGRETALVALAVEWAELGHEVYAFVPRDEVSSLAFPKALPERGGIVRWIPMQRVLSVAPVLGLDLFISWENLEVFEQLGSVDVGTRIVEMQVAHLHTADDEQLERVGVDYIAALSEWAADFLKRQHPEFPRERIIVFPNGVDVDRFVDAADYDLSQVDLGTMNYIYSSSPDRGLHHLLEIWPEIRTLTAIETGTDVDEVMLHVCYGAEQFVSVSRWAHNSSSERALAIERLMGQPGVVYHGKIGQDRLAALMLACDALLYPFDPMSPTETGCITIVEALTAQLPVVTTNGDCLGTEFGDVTYQAQLPLDHSEYIGLVAKMIRDRTQTLVGDLGVVTEVRRQRVNADVARAEFVAGRDWSVIAASWINDLERIVTQPEEAVA